MTLSHEIIQAEHFCTLFDHKFLPMGLNLHASLARHSKKFHLWVLCIDELVEQQLKLINLPCVTLISVADIETELLLKLKAERSRGEYCWTLTPFIFSTVFYRCPEITRLTYLDADLFFFRDPKILLDEFTESNRDVLVTEHAYDPRYDQSLFAGRFCVQFLTFKNTDAAHEVMSWWQKKCLDWCLNKLEDGKFGDQKYLDVWPDLFPGRIWILQQKENTMAPWNVRYFYQRLGPSHKPVFFHFHGLRIIEKNRLLLYVSYRIGSRGFSLYQEYLTQMKNTFQVMAHHGLDIPILPFKLENYRLSIWGLAKRFLLDSIKFVSLQ